MLKWFLAQFVEEKNGPNAELGGSFNGLKMGRNAPQITRFASLFFLQEQKYSKNLLKTTLREIFNVRRGGSGLWR